MARWRRRALQGDDPAADRTPADGTPAPGAPRPDAWEVPAHPAWETVAAPESDILAGGWRGPGPPRRTRPHSPTKPHRRTRPHRAGGPDPPGDPAVVPAVSVVRRLQRWARDPRSWRAPVAFGLLLGAVGMHAYDARVAAQSRRDAVVLSARVASEDFPGGLGGASWSLPIVLTNNGATPVWVQAARLVDGQYPSSMRQVSGGVALTPGQDSRITLVVAGACPGGGPVTPPRAVQLRVVTTGRAVREVTVRLADDRSELLAAARQTCLDADFRLWLTAEAAGAAVTRAGDLAIPIRFRLNGTRPQQVSAVRTTAPGLLAVVDPLPLRFVAGMSAVATLRWVLADCVQARDASYEQIRVRATVTLSPGPPTAAEVTMILDGDVVLAVVRFVTASCG